MKEQIINLVSERLNVPVEAMLSKGNKPLVCRARYTATFLLYKWGGMNWSDIARTFNRIQASNIPDRASVIYWFRKAHESIKNRDGVSEDLLYLDAICEDLAA